MEELVRRQLAQSVGTMEALLADRQIHATLDKADHGSSRRNTD
jgi:hypothetical protein